MWWQIVTPEQTGIKPLGAKSRCQIVIKKLLLVHYDTNYYIHYDTNLKTHYDRNEIHYDSNDQNHMNEMTMMMMK
jgi:hypothetical protein